MGSLSRITALQSALNLISLLGKNNSMQLSLPQTDSCNYTSLKLYPMVCYIDSSSTAVVYFNSIIATGISQNFISMISLLQLITEYNQASMNSKAKILKCLESFCIHFPFHFSKFSSLYLHSEYLKAGYRIP
jgi:hypothetical protein